MTWQAQPEKRWIAGELSLEPVHAQAEVGSSNTADPQALRAQLINSDRFGVGELALRHSKLAAAAEGVVNPCQLPTRRRAGRR